MGDIVYSINGYVFCSCWHVGTYFAYSSDIEHQNLLLRSILDKEDKRFDVDLISRDRFMSNHVLVMIYREKGIPRIEQIILPDRFCKVEVKKFEYSDFTYISSISSFQFLFSLANV